jgi:hypothetical protein
MTHPPQAGLRPGNYGFTPLDEDLGKPNDQRVVTPLMAKAQRRSDRLGANAAEWCRKTSKKKPNTRKKWFDAKRP